MSAPLTHRTADVLEELRLLAEGNIYARACLREFLNTKPIIAALEVDCGSATRTGHRIVDDEPSEELLACLAAARAVASNEKGDAFSGAEAHEITPEMIEAGYRVLAASGITDDLLEADRLLVEQIYRAICAAQSRESRL